MPVWSDTWMLSDDGRTKACTRCGEIAYRLGSVACARCMHIIANYPIDADFFAWLDDVLTIREEKLREELRRGLS